MKFSSRRRRIRIVFVPYRNWKKFFFILAIFSCWFLDITCFWNSLMLKFRKKKNWSVDPQVSDEVTTNEKQKTKVFAEVCVLSVFLMNLSVSLEIFLIISSFPNWKFSKNSLLEASRYPFSFVSFHSNAASLDRRILSNLFYFPTLFLTVWIFRDLQIFSDEHNCDETVMEVDDNGKDGLLKPCCSTSNLQSPKARTTVGLKA